MTDNDDNSDERSLFAKILRRSADELEQPDGGDGDGDAGTTTGASADGDADVEQRADDDPDDDESGEDEQEGVDPVDRALSEGTIEAAQASKLRDVTGKMDSGGVQTLVDAISENDLDVEAAVDMIEAYQGEEEEMPAPDDGSGSPEELKARADDGDGPADAPDDGTADADLEQLQSRLDTVDELADRLDDLEQRLADLPTSEDVDEQVAQRLEQVGEDLDEQFEDLIQRADVVDSPSPTAGAADDDRTLGDVVRIGGTSGGE